MGEIPVSIGLGGGKGVGDSFGDGRVRTTIGFVSLVWNAVC